MEIKKSKKYIFLDKWKSKLTPSDYEDFENDVFELINWVFELSWKECEKSLIDEIPNDISLSKLSELISGLLNDHIIPDKITTSAEGGICLEFKKENQRLYFEVYNNGEMGYIIEDTVLKKTIENEDASSIWEFLEKLNKFLNKD